MNTATAPAEAHPLDVMLTKAVVLQYEDAVRAGAAALAANDRMDDLANHARKAIRAEHPQLRLPHATRIMAYLWDYQRLFAPQLLTASTSGWELDEADFDKALLCWSHPDFPHAGPVIDRITATGRVSNDIVTMSKQAAATLRVTALDDWRSSFVMLPGDRGRLWTPACDPVHTPELLLKQPPGQGHATKAPLRLL
jgi:hypothetical protein